MTRASSMIKYETTRNRLDPSKNTFANIQENKCKFKMIK